MHRSIMAIYKSSTTPRTISNHFLTIKGMYFCFSSSFIVDTVGYHYQCKESYDVEWSKSRDSCPNLLNNETKKPVRANVPSPEQGRWCNVSYNYNSIAEMWSAWNGQYVDATFPRLIIRFEDMIFHTEKVVQSISQCSGWSQRDVFKYAVEPSKIHGWSTDFLGALMKTGTAKGRYANLTLPDFEYSRRAFNQTLMDLFQYVYGPGPIAPTD
jgi:hypothetical protein